MSSSRNFVSGTVLVSALLVFFFLSHSAVWNVGVTIIVNEVRVHMGRVTEQIERPACLSRLVPDKEKGSHLSSLYFGFPVTLSQT